VLLSVLASIGIVLLIPASSFASSSVTDVTGTVTSNGSPVKGATVTVVCDSNQKTTTTASNGSYRVQYSYKKCTDGSKATVMATKGSKGGTNSGIVNQDGSAALNVAIVNVSLVPEFGIVTGVSAAILGGATFLVIRRRELGQK
jgi:hypothetical protein